MIAVVVSRAGRVGKRRRTVGARGQHAQGGPPAPKQLGGRLLLTRSSLRQKDTRPFVSCLCVCV